MLTAGGGSDVYVRWDKERTMALNEMCEVWKRCVGLCLHFCIVALLHLVT